MKWVHNEFITTRRKMDSHGHYLCTYERRYYGCNQYWVATPSLLHADWTGNVSKTVRLARVNGVTKAAIMEVIDGVFSPSPTGR